MLALLVALLLRAGIPTGYMLAPADGLPQIVPCPGTAPATPHHHGGQHDQHGKESAVPCAFALVAPPALPGASLVLAPPATLPPAPLVAAIRYAAFTPRAASPPPPATGPPALR